MATPWVTIPYSLPLKTQEHIKLTGLEYAFSRILLSLIENFYRNVMNFTNKKYILYLPFTELFTPFRESKFPFVIIFLQSEELTFLTFLII